MGEIGIGEMAHVIKYLAKLAVARVQFTYTMHKLHIVPGVCWRMGVDITSEGSKHWTRYKPDKSLIIRKLIEDINIFETLPRYMTFDEAKRNYKPTP